MAMAATPSRRSVKSICHTDGTILRPYSALAHRPKGPPNILRSAWEEDSSILPRRIFLPPYGDQPQMDAFVVFVILAVIVTYLVLRLV
jgi:hypothetical protein